MDNIVIERENRHQKHAARIINFKDRFTHAQPLLHDMKALYIFQIALFNIIYFMFKCKMVIASLLPNLKSKYNI